MRSSVLFQNDSKTVVLLDLPRSIEEAQVPSSSLENDLKSTAAVKLRKLVSGQPQASPFSTPEPKKNPYGSLGQSQSAASSPSAQVAELMMLAACEAALEEIIQSYNGLWCLSRCHSRGGGGGDGHSQEEQEEHGTTVGRDSSDPVPPETTNDRSKNPVEYIIPEESHYLLGSIESQRPNFLSQATPPKFDLMILDPPWPNRSAKRKRCGGGGSYQSLTDLESLRQLLSLIPVASRLSANGLVAVWVTNSPRSADLLTSPRGFFDEWQVELVGEWTWLKVTSGGEPIVDLHSAWRKPWERLLIAKKRGGKPLPADKGWPNGLQRKVIVTVPDVHSRKPNLRGLFDEILAPGYQALEVFARNLTAGWWCWGDQVLLFQHRDHWVEVDTDTTGGESR
ncbi:MT-A70-domain-containing protein [Apodospora peruviana]|uniref:MT-A70-domain-containing protein n=1 Tax=Apodospora peruviana TaxID=516989 RepID=A0AAE0I4N6_9PEZI|nr:MT-A70-domain-containing protein [Apodospora peruviana]